MRVNSPYPEELLKKQHGIMLIFSWKSKSRQRNWGSVLLGAAGTTEEVCWEAQSLFCWGTALLCSSSTILCFWRHRLKHDVLCLYLQTQASPASMAAVSAASTGAQFLQPFCKKAVIKLKTFWRLNTQRISGIPPRKGSKSAQIPWLQTLLLELPYLGIPNPS